MFIIKFICKNDFVIVLKYCILLIVRYTYSKNVHHKSSNADVIDFAAAMIDWLIDCFGV